MVVGRIVRIAVTAALLTAIGVSVSAASAVISGYYFPDKPFPQYMSMWHEGWNLKDSSGAPLVYAKPDMPLGGYAFVYFRNTSDEPAKITDLTVDGVKLSEGLGKTHEPKKPDERFQCSILLSKLPRHQIDKLRAAGTPVWWKPDPSTVPAGGLGSIILRLRRNPQAKSLRLGIVTEQGTVIPAVVKVGDTAPRFTSIDFTPDMSTVYLYMIGSKARPAKVMMDDRDVTSLARFAVDPVSNVIPVVLKLDKPLEWMSYHIYRVIMPDGSAATYGIRSWERDIVYGMWGAAGDMGNTLESGCRRAGEWNAHNLNAIMGMYPGKNNPSFFGDEGWKYTESLGMGRMMHWIVPGQTPLFYFLMDEPDAADASTEQVDPLDRLGTNGQWLVKWDDILRRHGHDTPTLINIDGTYKPENYYTYHQLPDIPCIDPYYQGQLDMCYNKHPLALGAYTKPTYVYAVASISQSAGAPKPLHVILCSSRDGSVHANGYQGRYPTPEEKRMEVYYAIAAGAKGLSFWWYTPVGNWGGCGSDNPAAKALYKEIGLLGAEVRTAGPVISTSAPADLPVEATNKLWVRTLLSGLDTAAVIVVNDDVLCDRVGTVVMPVRNSKATVGMPSWLTPKDAFEVTYEGIKDVTWKPEESGVSLDLGTVNLSRFIIVTSDMSLRKRLEDLYQRKFAANVAALLR